MEKSAVFDAVARTGRALTSGVRLELMTLMAQRERSVQELAGLAALNMTTASAHLQVLRECGLVRSRREGTRIFYRLASADVAALMEQLCSVAETHHPEVQAALRSVSPPDGIRLMSRSELLDASASGRVIVLDARPLEEYRSGHWPGAISIPVSELPDRLSEIPPDVEVVAYCRDRYCLLSHQASATLAAHGRAAAVVGEGVLEWVAAGLEFEIDEPPEQS